MAKQSSLFKTIATIIATSAVTLSVAVGAVVGRALNKQNQNSQIPGQNGQGETLKSIDRVEKTNTYGLIDEYTIYYTDGTTSIFIVTNGSDGQPGAQGFPGRDGVTPTITIENGKWVINGQVTELDAVGPQGPQGPQGPAGQNGLTPYIGPNGHWWIGETDTGVQARGMDGEDGYIPLIGENGNWWIGGTDTGVPAQGQSGRGIQSIEKTDSQGLIDVYTITYTDGTTSTFLVTNGADGSAQGQGIPGPAGHTPVITVGENGNWFVDGVDTGTHAQGPQGQNGQDGYNVLTGEGVPAADLGKNGDSYIDLLNWDYYVMDNGAWTKVGNIAGANGVSGSSVSAGNGDPTTNNIPGNPGDTYIDLSTGDVYHMGDNGEWGSPEANSNFALPHVGANGNWWVGDEDTGVAAQGPAGQDGSSIHTGSGNPSGDPDNGVPAVPGNAGDTYIDLSTGDVYHMGDNGEWGSPDSSSSFAIPHIGENGHWYVGETDTGINATGPQGPQGPQGASVSVNHGDPTTNSVEGKQGDTYIDLDTGYYYTYDETNGWVKSGEGAAATSVLTGSGEPANTTGKDGDSYINLANWDFYVKEAGEWNLAGNIKGADGATGAQGASVNVGHGNPTTGNVSGNVGDTYIDLDTGNYYTMTNEGWGEPAGGGAIGTSIRYGNTAPDNSLGNNGDSYINTETWDYYAKVDGAWVLQGNFAGQNGTNGVSISSVEKTNTEGLVDTYTITYSDSTNENPHTQTFTVTNGADGNKIIVGTGAPTSETVANEGDNYIDVETWKLYVKAEDSWTDKGSFKGDAGQDGVSIVSVALKESNDLVDLYEITYSDSTATDPHVDTFTVTNGKDGTSVRTGHRDPRAVIDDPVTPEDETLAAVSGIEGDSFIDLDTWNFFVLQDDGEGNLFWNPEGNLHYSPNRYTVTFDSNGGSAVDSYDEALEGFTIVNPTAPTQDGYFFQGWYTSEGTRWDFSKDVITQDTTLTARWGQFIVEDGIITDCSITSGDIVIPEFYDNQLVVGIGDEAFMGETGITSFTLPHTVKSIGNSAFEGCTGLTSVVIPSNVKSIGNDAFKDCSNVAYVYVEEGAANPGISTLRSLPQTNGLETIGNGAFAGCSSLKGIVLPSTVKSIGKGAFEDCDSLESYTAPFIGGSAESFAGWIYCSGEGEPATNNPSGTAYFDKQTGSFWAKVNGEWQQTTMQIPLAMTVNGVPTASANDNDMVMDTETGKIYVYSSSSASWSFMADVLTAPDMINVLSNYTTNATYLSFVFGGNSYEDNDDIPSSLKTVTITGDYAIDVNAMNGCRDVETIIISGNPSSIGLGAFKNCDDLVSITLPYIGPDSSCAAPLTYSYGHGEPDSVDPSGTTYFDIDTKYYWQLHEGQWINLTVVADNDILTGIATNPNVTVGAGSPTGSNVYVDYETGNVYSYYGGEWMLYTNLLGCAEAAPSNNYFGYIFGSSNPRQQNYDIPNNLETIVLTAGNGENKEYIPSYAFYGCEAENIVLPNNIKVIEDYAFAGTEMTSFVVPDSVEYMGKGVFYDADVIELTLPFMGKERVALSKEEGSLDYLFDNHSNNVKTVILTGGNGVNGDTIPDFAFASSGVVNVVIPEGVTKIGDEAFHFCLHLTSVSLPSTLKVIGKACFYQTSHLTELNLPQGLTRIEAGALADTNCTTFVIPSSVTFIGDRAFRYNSNLKSVVFQDGMDKQFGDNVFQDCDALENVYLGHGITKVNNKMFADLKSLKVVALAETITEIGDLAFRGCTSLKSINLPANLESIGIQAFYHCTDLESFVMPNRVTSLGRMAFEGCISLKYLTLSEGLEKIEVQTFEGCTSLQAVALPSNLKELGTRTFFGCTSLKYIVLNEGLENISEFAFTGCDSLESIIIPDSVKDIGRGAFSTGLTRKGNLWDKYSPERTEFANIQVTSTYELPSSGEIGDIRVFTDANHYGEIWVRYDSGSKWELRDTIVGFELFYDVISPTSIESGKLFINSADGDLLVEYRSKLDSITLPFVGGSVDSIGEHIYSGALADGEKPANDIGNDNDLYIDTASSSIYRKINGQWQGQVTLTLENGELSTMDAGTDTPDPDDAASYDYYINTDTGEYWYKTADDKWGDSVGHIQDMFNSFGYFFVAAGSKQKSGFLNGLVPESLKTVVLSNMTELKSGAFNECSYIETVILPDTLEKIGAMAFKGCTGLDNIELPESLLNIGDYAFYNCTGFTSIVLPNSLKTIGFGAFEGCDSLETMVVPFVGGSYGATYNYGHGAPTNNEESEVYFDIDGRTVWYKTNGQWEEVDFSTYGLDISVAPIGEGAPSGTANDDDCYIDYIAGDWYRYSGDSNEWFLDGWLTMLFEFNSSYFAYIFGAEIYDDQNPYDSKVPDSLKTVVLNSGTKFIAGAMAEDVIYGAAFAYCDHIENIVLPNDIIDIYPSAFYHCESLKQISLPSNLEGIGDFAFVGCIALESIAFPDKVNYIGGNAFQDCSSLAYAVFSPNSNLDYMSDHIFSNCVSLKSFVAPNGTKTIWNLAFENCSSLESLIIPNTVEELGNDILKGCSSLKYLSVPFLEGDYYNPDFKTDLASTAINYRDPLDCDIYNYFYNNVTGDVFFRLNDGWHLLYHHDNFVEFSFSWSNPSYTYPSNPAIGTTYVYAFGSHDWMQFYTGEGWTDPIALDYHFLGSFFGGVDNSVVPATLKNVVITGDNSKIINAYAFAGCTNLETVTLPDSYERIDHGMFSGCTSLKAFAFGENIKTIGDYAFANAGLTSIIIPDTVTTIGAYAFAGYSFESFVIPDTVTSIGLGVIQGWNNLATLSVPFVGQTSGTNNYLGHLFGATSSATSGSAVPSSLKTIIISGNCAFSGDSLADCEYLENLVISELTILNDGSLKGIPNIKSLTLGKMDKTIDKLFGNSYNTYSHNVTWHYYTPDSLKAIIVLKGSGENEDEIISSAFSHCETVETIIIPDNIKVINNAAFKNCLSLKNLNLPEGLTTIGSTAFQNCWSLETIIVPDSVTSIYVSAFSCRGHSDYDPLRTAADGNVYSHMKYVKLPKNLETMESSLFMGNSGIEQVVLSDNMTTIPNATFQSATNLRSVVIPDGVTSIGTYAFMHCDSLVSVTLPKSLETLGEMTFAFCYSLKEIIGLEYTKLTTLGNRFTFEYNTSLMSVVLPETLTVIPNYCFMDCHNLSYVYIPNNVTTIESGAFENCYSLSAINVNRVTTIESIAFYKCKALKTFTYNSYGYAGNSYDPQYLSTIGNEAFSGCSLLETVILPDSLTSIGGSIFTGCYSLRYLSIPFVGKDIDTPSTLGYLNLSSDTQYRLETLIITKGTNLPDYFASFYKNLKTVIAKQVTTIGSSAFNYCELLENIQLNSVTSIGNSAFECCYNLTSLFQDDGYNPLSNLKTIGDRAFYACFSFDVVYIHHSVERIGRYAFAYCNGLQDVFFHWDANPIIDSYAFAYCDNLKSVKLSNEQEEIGEFAFYEDKQLQSIIFPSSIKTIGYHAFANCESLAYVLLPEGLETIEASAFSGCALKSIVVPNSVTNIGHGAFGSCMSVESIVVPDVGDNWGYTFFGSIFGASDIDDQNDYVPKSLKTVVITGDKPIYDKAFMGLEHIETINIEGNPSSIGANVFLSCASLKRIVLPYVGAASTIGNIFVNDGDPTTYYWSSGSYNIRNNPDSTAIIYELYEGDLNDLPEGSVVIRISDGDVMVLVKEFDYSEYSLATYEGSDIAYPHIVPNDGNWFVGDTDTGIPAPGQVVDFWWGDPNDPDEGILSSTYHDWAEDDDPWWPYIDVNTFNVYFINNWDQPKNQWTWAIGGNFIKDGIQAVAFESHVPSWWDSQDNVDSLPEDILVVSLGEGLIARATKIDGHIQLSPYEGDFNDVINLPRGSSATWYIGDTNTNVPGTSFGGLVYGHGNPTSNNTDANNPSLAYVDLDTLDVYLVDYENNCWFSSPSGNLKKAGSAANIVAEENYSSGYFDDSYYLEQLGEGTIVVSLANQTARYIVKTDHYWNNWQDYDGDIGYDLPYIYNGYWYVGGTNTNIPGDYQHGKKSGHGAPSIECDPGYAYVDLDTFNVYFPMTDIKDGDIYIDTSSGDINIRTGGNWFKEDQFAVNATILSGTADPNDSEGEDGNYFVNTNSGDILLKKEGSWGTSPYENLYRFFFRMNYYYMKFGANSVHVPEVLETVIVNNITTVSSYAFNGCEHIKNIVLVDNVTAIDAFAFEDCFSLESINLPDGITTIGDGAFLNCSSLKSIDIPSSLTSIGDYAFSFCSSLEMDLFLSDITIGEFAFECSGILSLDIRNIDEIKESTFANCNKMISATIVGIPNIGESAFADCQNLESAYFQPSSLGSPISVSIGEYAFTRCYSLRNLGVNMEGLTFVSLGEGAFSYCRSLPSIDLSKFNCDISDDAFNSCTSLTYVNTGSGVTAIGERSFAYCSALTFVEIGANVNRISSMAFINCLSLTTIHIKSTASMTIEEYAFMGCYSLSKIHYDGDSSTWESNFYNKLSDSDKNYFKGLTVVFSNGSTSRY